MPCPCNKGMGGGGGSKGQVTQLSGKVFVLGEITEEEQAHKARQRTSESIKLGLRGGERQ